MMQTITLTLTPQHLAAISEALGLLPYRVAAPVVADLQAQINAQENPAPPKVVAAE